MTGECIANGEEAENWEKEIFETISLGLNVDALKAQLKEYREWVQTNQIVIEGWLEPEPSMIYYNGRGKYYVRSQFQFKIVSFKKNENLMWDDRAQYQNLEKGVVYKGYADISIGTNVQGDRSAVKVLAGASVFENNNLPK